MTEIIKDMRFRRLLEPWQCHCREKRFLWQDCQKCLKYARGRLSCCPSFGLVSISTYPTRISVVLGICWLVCNTIVVLRWAGAKPWSLIHPMYLAFRMTILPLVLLFQCFSRQRARQRDQRIYRMGRDGHLCLQTTIISPNIHHWATQKKQ